MISKNLKLLTLFLFALLFSYCEEAVDIGESVPEQLVVNCLFAPDTTFRAFISKSRDPLSSDNIQSVSIQNADVKIFRGEEMVAALLLQNATDGSSFDFYTNNDYKIKQGAPYTIRVEAPGFEEVMATDQIPEKTKITDVQMTDLETILESDSIANFKFQVKLLLEEVSILPAYYYLDMNYQWIPFQVVGNDTILDRTGEFRSLSLKGKEGNPIAVKHFDEERGGILFSRTEPGMLELNFEVRTPEALLLSQDLFEKVYVNLRTISKDYYQNHLQLSRQQLQKDSFFINPIILTDNIENGYGIFAGYQLTRDSLSIDHQ